MHISISKSRSYSISNWSPHADTPLASLERRLNKAPTHLQPLWTRYRWFLSLPNSRRSLERTRTKSNLKQLQTRHIPNHRLTQTLLPRKRFLNHPARSRSRHPGIDTMCMIAIQVVRAIIRYKIWAMLNWALLHLQKITKIFRESLLGGRNQCNYKRTTITSSS